ncbi:hypothetical protein SAMN06264364_13016 [Quadrisphaera granulorum]|uniref:Uncharacterized protein n=1 Tax=Quadrisphaera granulorum TaxID=317664 RepID=A0A315ZT21_9ACTN|nr:hypothetical protein [Quadrisphaera granulorum]PWJ48452.1 hypothetical protein BXY45_13016 [Quadrisphaera granulorum]SZE98411.1 hypothetical protein SAMN06264364_13016 [Quadrisphaera granulorum]
MHLLCVIDVDVEVRPGALERSGIRTTAAAIDIVLEHLRGEWERHYAVVPGTDELSADGFTVLPTLDDPTVLHDLRWSAVGHRDEQDDDGGRGVRHSSAPRGALVALRADLYTPLGPEGRMRARTTVTSHHRDGARHGDSHLGAAGGVHVRMSTGRELLGHRLVPLDEPAAGRPPLLASLTADPRLRVTCRGQDLDGRMPSLTSTDDGDDVLTALRQPQRLPVLLADPATQPGWGLARRAATELQGLARVVVVRKAAKERLAEAAPEFAPPPGGLRLVWPDLAVEHPTWDEGEAVAAEPPFVEVLFRQLAAASALAGGRDGAWFQARRRSSGRGGGERGASSSEGDQGEEVASLRAELDEWAGEVALLGEENERLREQVEALEALRFELDRWRARATALEAEVGPDQVRWSDAPALDPRDAKPLFAFLEDASGGTLRFTAKAARAWAKCSYVHPAKMREALVSLAQAARDYSEREGLVEGRMTDWFLAGYGLDVALTDTPELTRRARFVYEGEELDAVPHIKLGDHTHPDACGRVYFAWSAQPPRFVVDHVGQHR